MRIEFQKRQVSALANRMRIYVDFHSKFVFSLILNLAEQWTFVFAKPAAPVGGHTQRRSRGANFLSPVPLISAKVSRFSSNLMRDFRWLPLFVSLSVADLYLHSPPGSNNRNRERKDIRKNANRVFDSQNNGKGGYPWRGDPRGKGVGDPLTYYVGSKLQIEWTNQNGCGGNPNVHCELIIQYACDDTLPGLRDGYPNDNQCFDSSKKNQNTLAPCNGNDTWIARRFRRNNADGTHQIPSPLGSLLSPDELNNKYINGSDYFIEYGLHENHLHYTECSRTKRNIGLYLADQHLLGSTALFTRQNPNGRRRGLECPEERDYYPYWRKQPWKDIAILVSNTSFCDFFQTQSQNVRTYGRCQCPHSESSCPISEAACISYNYTWVTDPSHGLNAPDCLYHPFTRDNHLGNSYEVDPSTGDFITPKPGSKPMNPHYKLTIPQDMAGKMCVIRLRYNVSTNDYPSHAYADKSNAQCNYKERDGMRYDDPSCGLGTRVNQFLNCPFVTADTECFSIDGFGNAAGNPDCDYTVEIPSKPECYRSFSKFTASSVPGGNRPFINLFNRDISAGAAFKLGFAVNTHQTARTFQDRSYVFRVAEAPVNASISNLGVRGRRGNIVQAYPAVEYDFVPSVLRCLEGDYIHIQFHGSDFNTARNQNNAEGWQYSDRTNIVRINSSSVNYPVYQEGIDFFNETEAVFFGWGGQDPTHCDRSIEDDDNKQNQFTNCGKLNMMPNRFPQDPAKGLKQCNARPGSYYHMSTRNNNFSNRVQKVLIIVQGPDTTAPTSSPVTVTPTSGPTITTSPSSSPTSSVSPSSVSPSSVSPSSLNPSSHSPSTCNPTSLSPSSTSPSSLSPSSTSPSSLSPSSLSPSSTSPSSLSPSSLSPSSTSPSSLSPSSLAPTLSPNSLSPSFLPPSSLSPSSCSPTSFSPSSLSPSFSPSTSCGPTSCAPTTCSPSSCGSTSTSPSSCSPSSCSPSTFGPTSDQSSVSGNKANGGLSTNAEIGVSFATVIFVGGASLGVTLYMKKKELCCFKKSILEQPSEVSLENVLHDGKDGGI
ncbi:hypothetical protein AAMO2058_001711700 [Amorphochlora amoebiformis]